MAYLHNREIETEAIAAYIIHERNGNLEVLVYRSAIPATVVILVNTDAVKPIPGLDTEHAGFRHVAGSNLLDNITSFEQARSQRSGP